MRKILIMGLPGAGKTTLAMRLAPLLGAVWFDADWVRKSLWPELGFDHDDRVENARRMGKLCDQVNASGHDVIASFVCPTVDTRLAFGATQIIWVDRIREGRFADTNQMFTSPVHYDLRFTDGTPDQWAETALNLLRGNDETAFRVGATEEWIDFAGRIVAAKPTVSPRRHVEPTGEYRDAGPARGIDGQ